MGCSTTTWERPGWQIPFKTPGLGFTTGLPALQLEPKPDVSRSHIPANDNDVGNMVLFYYPFPRIKTPASSLCPALDNSCRARWTGCKWRLSPGWTGCSLLQDHVRLQAVLPEEAFSAVLGITKKQRHELKPLRSDADKNITLVIFTFVLMNWFPHFLFFWFSDGMNSWIGGGKYPWRTARIKL